MALPGVKTVLKDRFYSISRQDTPVGPRIVVIGKRTTANNTGGVADLDVVQIVNEADAITAFGDSSHLHKAFVELVSGGADRIYMVPLPATSLIIQGGVSTQADIKLADNTTSIFDDAFNAAEAAQPDIIVMWGRGGHPYEWDIQGATPNASTTDTDFGFYADDTTTVLKSMSYRVAQAVKPKTNNVNPTT